MKKMNLCMTIFAMALSFFCHNALAADLEMQSTAAQAEKEMTLTFSISNAPNPVYSFGFDLSYDATLMEYKSYSFAGSLVQQFEFLHVNPFSAGKIRVGGMDAGSNIIAQNASGTLVTLTFTVMKPGSAQISIQNQTDDIAAWSAANAQIFSKDAYEPDNLHPLSGVIDKVQRHNFHEAGDADWGMVYGTAGKSYTVKTGNPEANCDTVIELYGIDGQTLIMSKNDNGAGTGESLAWSCTQDTIYFVKITNSNPNAFGDGTAYDLWVEYPPEFDAYEPDNTSDDARNIIVDFRPQTHGLLTQNDEDWVHFDAVAGENYTIEMNPLGTCDIAIELYGIDTASVRRSGETLTLLKTENSAGPGQGEILAWQCPEDGRYYIRFIQYISAKRTGDARSGECCYEVSVRSSLSILNGKIFGTVSSVSGLPIEDVRVEANCAGGECRFVQKYGITNPAGNYAINELSGDILLTASKAGYQTYAYIRKDNKTGEIIERDENISKYQVSFFYDNYDGYIDIEMIKCLSDIQGDINGDLQITPEDALSAFQRYLEICPTSKGIQCDRICCDVNKDGQCTPADALCIFWKYLEKPCCLD